RRRLTANVTLAIGQAPATPLTCDDENPATTGQAKRPPSARPRHAFATPVSSRNAPEGPNAPPPGGARHGDCRGRSPPLPPPPPPAPPPRRRGPGFSRGTRSSPPTGPCCLPNGAIELPCGCSVRSGG